MRYRKKIRKNRSKRIFRKTVKPRPTNYRRPGKRGGIRL